VSADQRVSTVLTLSWEARRGREEPRWKTMPIRHWLPESSGRRREERREERGEETRGKG